jgi:hypothetical protein
MRSVSVRILCASAVLLGGVVYGGAQERQAGPATTDPRIGLKAGFSDAGEAIRNLEKVATLPTPVGLFYPNAPAGEPTPPEREEWAGGRGGDAP